MTPTIDTPLGPAHAGRPTHRWLEWLLGALPALAFLTTFGVFFVHRNREARTVVRSARGLLTLAALVVGYIVLALVVRWWARRAWVAPVLLTMVILGLAAWIVRPYYVDETAERRLVTGPLAEAPTASASTGDAPSALQTPPMAQRISTGRLRGIGHDASGSVSLIRNPDGSLVVRFEGFHVEGTPDPRVYLIEGNDKRSPAGVSLGRLKGNRGQVLDYAVPAGPSAGPGWTVLVWCGAFSVPIANATQAAA